MKGKIAIIGVTMALVVGFAVATAFADVIEINPTDDAYVRDTKPDTNYGSFGALIVGHDPWFDPVNIHRSYLKFDLGVLPSGAVIDTAELYLYNFSLNYPAVDVGAHYLSNDGWSEGSITWNNAPTGFNSVATDLKTISMCVWTSWDVTPDVQAASAGDRVYSVVMKEPTADEGKDTNSVGFDSKEAGAGHGHPYLRIRYSEPEWGKAIDSTVDLTPYFDWGAITSLAGLAPPGTMGIYTHSHPTDTGFYFPSDSLAPAMPNYAKAWLTPGVHLATNYGPDTVRINTCPVGVSQVTVPDRNSKPCSLFVQVPPASLIDEGTDLNVIQISSGESKTIPINGIVETMVFLASCDGYVDSLDSPIPSQPLEVRLNYNDGTADTVVNSIHPAGRLDINDPYYPPSWIFIYGNEVFVCSPAYFNTSYPYDLYHSEAWHWYGLYPDTTKLLDSITFVGIQSGDHSEVYISAISYSGTPPVRDTVVCEPQIGNPSHPPTYWYDVTPGYLFTPGDFGRCDFHVKVYDSNAANYTNWVEPAGWTHQLHKVGNDWWVSWWNAPCTAAIFSTFRFQFNNPNPSAWGDWTTTTSATNIPDSQVVDSSGNHTAEPDGYGYRVHVPRIVPPDSAIILDTVYGLSPDGKLIAGQDIKFMMRWIYSTGNPIPAFTNGFRVYSPDGATWDSISADTVSLGWGGMFDGGVFIFHYSANGSGADTAGVGGFRIVGPGLTAPFDSLVWWIETEVYPQDTGKHLCVDSSFFPPGGAWLWATTAGSFVPYWSGPHCFEIVASCCNHDGIRGDVNCDSALNIADVTELVDFLFRGGPALCCFEEADVNCDTSVNIADLTYLIDYFFRGGPPPMPCNCAKNSPTAKTRTGISLNTTYEDGTTVISLESPVDLRGIQIELSGKQTGDPVKLVEDDLELFFHQKDGAARLGILDLEGEVVIKQGAQTLVRLAGRYEIVDALVSDLQHNALVPAINPAAKETSLPAEFSLNQNYPNPFNPTTKISFSLPEAVDVKLAIYNIMGQKVTTLIDGKREAGEHVVQWDGSKVASGVYFYRITAGEFDETKKMLLLK